jgi:hypothetical protein
MNENENRDSEKNVLSTMRQLNKDKGGEEFWRRLYGDESLEMVSDLAATEITALTQVSWFAQTFGQDWLDSLVRLNLKYRVSKSRLGRKEAMKAFGGSLEQKARSLFRFRSETG